MTTAILSTPIYANTFPMADKNALLEKVTALAADNESYNGYYTTNQLHKDALFRPTCEQIIAHTRAYLQELGHETKDGSPYSLVFSRMWATQFTHEKAIQIHQHSGQGAVITGVIYLQLPTDAQSGICFHPRHQPFMERIPFRQSFSDVVDVGEDLILLFPSEVLHSGVPNDSVQKRVSLAFDLVYFDNLYGPLLT